jgi:HSP20 family protein
MVDRLDQQRPSDQDRSQSDQSRGVAPRDDQNDLSNYQGSYQTRGTASPFELMRRFSEDVDRMFASLGFGSMFEPWGTSRAGRRQAGTSAMSTMAWAPSVDINTRGDDLVVSADLPGIKPENVQIECDANRLIIRGETKDERSQNDKERGYWYSERNYGSFYRSIPLPQGVNTDNARADFKDGVLEVTFPGAAKSLNPQRRRIEIQGAQQAGDTQPMQSSQTTQQGTQSGQSISQRTGESSQTTR